MPTNVLQKSLTWTLVASTILWAMSAALLGFAVPSASALSGGDLIKISGLSSVYYYGSDGKRYVFPNDTTYFTWYSDFSGVVTISSEEMGAIAFGSNNVVFRPGTYAVKITTDPKVYAVEPGGVLRHIQTEADAEFLFGANWNTMVRDVPDAFFASNYSIGDPLPASTYPEGSLLQWEGSSDIYYVDGDGNRRLIADTAAFDANMFQNMFVLTAASSTSLPDGSSLTGEETDLTDTAQIAEGGSSGSSSAAGTLTVAIASDTPASSTLVKNAARVGLLKVNFTAAADGDAVVDSLQIERTGLCSDSNFTDVLLLDQDGNQVGNEKSFGSTHKVTFNDDLTIPAGTTKSYTFGANMAATLQAAENCSYTLNEVNMSGSTTVVGSLPITGNEMTTNNTITIGTTTIAAGGLNPSASTQKVGQTDYIVSSVKITAGSAEDQEISKLSFYQNGSAGTGDLENFELIVDGVVVKTVASVSGKDLVFDLSSNPIKITKGNNKEFSVRLDIVDGSNRTISWDFEKKTGVTAKGLTYGFFINPSYPNSAAPYYNAPNTTIGVGSITASKGVLTTTNVAEGASQQEIAAVKFNVQGEPMIVTSFEGTFTVTGTGNAADLTNITLYDADGEVVAGPVDPAASGFATTTDTFTIPVGINTYIVKADLNSDFAANDTIQMSHNPRTALVSKGEITNTSINEDPNTTVSYDTITVKVGSLQVNTLATPTAQTVIIGQTGFTFAKFLLDASNSGEDVRVNQMAVRHTSTRSVQTNIANLQFFEDDGTAILPVVSPSASTASPATSTFTFTSPIVVPAGESKTILLKGDIATGNANEGHAFSCVGAACITAVGAETANSITASVTNSDGQVMTLATAATVTVADDASDPNNALVAAGSTGVTVGQVRITSSNGDSDLTEFVVDVNQQNSGNQDEIDMLYLYDGSTKVAEATPTSTTGTVFTLSAGEFRIPAGSTGKKLTIKADFANIGTGFTGSSGQGFNLDVDQDEYKFTDVSSGSNIAAASKSGTYTGAQFHIYKSLPTVTQLSVGTTLSNGSNKILYKFSVAADSKGDIGFYKAAFEVTTSSATVTAFQLFEDPDGSRTNLTNNGSRAIDEIITTSTYGSGRGGTHKVNVLFDTGSDAVANGGEYRTISAGSTKTFQLEATVSNASSGSSVQTKLSADNAFPGTFPNCAGTTTGGNACTGIDSDDQDNFIWSDLNLGNNSTTATNSAEWTNSFRVFATTTGSTLSL